ncbi:anthranilate synthase component I [Niveibacterium sp. SC-1]|uniref:anthranilate synthase component I n=1 Tax=Niveibacterium sp. SC-1 TaxID=3135646 RepID=UPI00311D7518
MTESEFLALAEQGYNRIPVTLETFADLDTPLSIYLKLANEPNTYLLESVQGGERFGRYSIIGLRANTRLEAYGRSALLVSNDRIVERRDYGDPLAYVGEFMQRIKVPPRAGLPRYCGGLVGCFGYDTVRYIEPRLAKHEPEDELETPDIVLLLSEEIAIVDNLSGKLTLVVYAEPEVPGAFKRAQRRLKELLGRLREPVEIPPDTQTDPKPVVSAFGEAGYKAAVERAKQYIVDGDIMQVVLSQRMSKPFAATPLALYRALRTLNPSPYMFYFNFEDFQVVGASPEILVKLEEGTVTVRPIAGTRPRGATPEEDLAYEKDLLTDQKELAEHLQLLDLGRNDVGRVAKTGTVKVTSQYEIERYSHVMHIVSQVEGKLPETGDKRAAALAVLRAAFPAGTVSGAPKVRAMEIIDELEPVKRGIYSGAVGYVGFDGELDVAIAIRTAVIKDGQLHVQAGAGIVADSNPDSEWQETLNKARAVLRAAEMAERGLDTRYG